MVTVIEMINEEEHFSMFKVRGEIFKGNLAVLYEEYFQIELPITKDLLKSSDSESFYKWIIKNGHRVDLISY